MKKLFTKKTKKKNEISPETQVVLSGPPMLKSSDIKFSKTDKIGEGNYGSVYKGRVKGLACAIKVPLKQTLEASELDSFSSEIEIMRKVYHPNVVLFLGACSEPGNIMIVIELMACDLDTVLHHRNKAPRPLQGSLSYEAKLHILLDAALGVNWIHGILNIVHRDLKPANLLMDNQYHVKVTDFGFAEVYDPQKNKEKTRGTPLYTAPEVWEGRKVTQLADVYSFGIIIWEVLSEEIVMPHISDITQFYQEVIVVGARPVIPKLPDSIAHGLKTLMTQCWDKNEAMRPPMSEVVSRLEDLLLKCSLSLPSAQNFWRNYFPETENGGITRNVEVQYFQAAISEMLDVPLKLFDGTDALLAPNQEIDLQRFETLCQVFGPFFQEKDKLEQLIELSHVNWISFDCSKETAESWLNSREDLMFIVRYSKTDKKYPFTLSLNKNNKTVHSRIMLHSGMYSMDTKAKKYQHSSLKSLVDELSHDKVIGRACPHSALNVYEGI